MSGEDVDTDGFKTLAVTDLEGNFKALHTRKVGNKSLDGSSIEGFQPIHDSDLPFKPLEGVKAREFFGRQLHICGIYNSEGERYSKDPRKILEDTMEGLKEEGYSAKVGVEPEFFILDGDEDPVDNYGYFDLETSEAVEMAMERMLKADIGVEDYHSEVAPSQWEIVTDFTDKTPVEVADETLLYKKIVRDSVEEFGKEATFDPKPFEDENGSGMHMNISLWNDGENLFAGEEGKISEQARYFIGGILEHADALSAVVSPTESSYERIVPGMEAPTKKASGEKNRSTLVRIPSFDSEEGARIEYRAPDPSCNPYLAFSAVIAAGMNGMEKEIEPEWVEGNAYDMEIEELPDSLLEALDYLEEDDVVRGALGEAYQPYKDLKEQE